VDATADAELKKSYLSNQFKDTADNWIQSSNGFVEKNW